MEVPGHEGCSPSGCLAPGRKCCVVGANNQLPSFLLDDYLLYEIENVSAIHIRHRDCFGWDVEHDPRQKGPIRQTYLMLEGIYDEAFHHWIYETAIFFPLVRRLQERYPGLKLYSFHKKNYKESVYKAFDISSSQISYSIEEPRNRFLFIRCTSQADHTTPHLYREYVRRFYTALAPALAPPKDIELLYLPRGSSENIRDFSIPVQPALLEALMPNPHVKVLFTDKTVDFREQIRWVQRAKVILLNEGTNCLVNGLFAVASRIVVLGGVGPEIGRHFQNPNPALVFSDTLRRGNRYFYIPYHLPPHHILFHLQQILHGLVPSERHPPVTCWKSCHFCQVHQGYRSDLPPH